MVKGKKMGQSEFASCRKSKKASAEDWTAVCAIAQEYAEEIDNAVALCEKLKVSEYYGRFGGNAYSPELSAKCNEVNFAFRELLGKCAVSSESSGRKWPSVFLRMSCESIIWICPRLAEGNRMIQTK